jgi:threonylcarbamoyladenosine tRNA methylthiotransferase MtaB
MTRTFSIKTLGCKLNQYESSLIAGQFLGSGWISMPFGEMVDLVIVNSCTVTNRSDKKCRNYIRQGSAFSRSGKVIVTGCLADRKDNNLNNMSEVLAVIKNQDKNNLLSIINKYFDNSEQTENADILKKSTLSSGNYNNKKDYPLPFYRTRGLLKIQDGCDGECSYCIVPSVRGKPVSRDFNEILYHARTLIESGCPELILTGITIGKYNSNNKGLPELVKSIANIEGNFRIRITSIEPNHVSGGMIDVFANEKVCRHIHIPLQSGSDEILSRMKRPYTIKEYLKTVEKIKKYNDNIAIGTDIIIGFPGETEEDFLSSCKLVGEAGFSYVHQFTYSRRTGTPSSEMKECNTREISERTGKLRELATGISLNYRQQFLGKILPSIIESNKTKKGYSAVSSNYIKMRINDFPDDINHMNQKTGKITNVQLVKVEANMNFGEVC